jgi:nitrite reductase/ring-hydroxylating ferredoxin subunit
MKRAAHGPDRHRRLFLAGGLVAALSTFFPFLAQAAGPTMKATKVGQKIVWRGYVYTVVKSRGKLVWKQGAKVAVASASASASAKPTSSATPAPTQSATPTPTPTQTASTTPTPTPSINGIFVANSSDIREGQVKIIEVNTAKNQYPSFSFSRLGGKMYAVSIICTHAGCKVVAEKTELVCNCHMSIFSPFDGAAQSGPARLPLTRYEVFESDGKIYIKP